MRVDRVENGRKVGLSLMEIAFFGSSLKWYVFLPCQCSLPHSQADRPKSVLVLENLCVECEDMKDAAQKYVLKLVAQKEKSLGDSGAKASPVFLCAPNEPARKDWLRAINTALQVRSMYQFFLLT